jgi:hypothetical protein
MLEPNPTDRLRIPIRSVAVWLLIIVSEILHGILRSVALVPLVGQFRANQIGVFTGSAIILAIAYFTIQWLRATRTLDLLLVGGIWLVLTASFEVLFGRLVMGVTWQRIWSDYNLLDGGLMPLGFLFLFFSPLLAAKWRAKRSRINAPLL